MRELDSMLRPWARRFLSVAVATLCVCACTSAGSRRPARVEVGDDGSFTVHDDVRVGAGTRNDFERALQRLAQEDYEAGIALLVEVTEAAPTATTPYIDLAIAYERVNDLANAEASLEKALALNPRHPVALNELGIVYRRTGRFAEARASYERTLALYPNFHFARRNLAILCDVYLADLDCALEHYQLYAKAVPGDEAAAMWIADLRTRAGK